MEKNILVATPIISVSTNFRRQTGNTCYDTAAEEARRSTTIVLINKSGTDISLTVATLEGKWTVNCDPNLVKVIKNGTDTTFASQSDGLNAVDVVGSATYIIGNESPPVSLTITWTNPLVGSVKYNVALSSDKYIVETPLPGNGNDALYHVIVKLSN
ncbi:hypothetical protein RhiirC2_858063 [Rhizophagus irregularis]|uniref:Uncharacterized protein n=1 Tax=Rhizophagus irregularis TaxID=588596 RepID=A0A2N1M845_9GLOM|nr:hypothetical protein RhiirC2_858063 [Rhizophagus irregularis]